MPKLILRGLFLVVSLVASASIGCSPEKDKPGPRLRNGSDIPKFVRLSFNDDPATTSGVVWYTENSVVKPGVEYGLTPSSLANFTPATTFQIQGFDGYFHEATLSSLRPASTYYYRVGAQSGMSEIFSFGTAHDALNMPLSFIVAGDSRGEGLGVAPGFSAFNRAVLRETPAFILDTGDYTLLSQPKEWLEWLEGQDTIGTSVPRLTTFGNHEMVQQTYFGLMNLPTGQAERWYAIKYGPMHVVCLNTGFGDEIGAEQTAWLKNELAGSSSPWKVAFFHMPPYNAGAHGDQEFRYALREAWVPLFEKYGVNLVLSGHDHNYQRFGHLISDKRSSDTSAPFYVITGGAGAPLYEIQSDNPDFGELEFSSVSEHYLKISVSADALQVVAKRVDGTVIDDFQIKK